MCTCAGAAQFTGSADVLANLLTKGGKFHWGDTLGALGVIQLHSEDGAQDAWSRRGGIHTRRISAYAFEGTRTSVRRGGCF